MKHLLALLLALPLLATSPARAAGPRVVALSWEAAEYLLNIGVTPLAVADRTDYRQWVIEPALSASVLDAGSRLEPNLERLHALKPDLIVINPMLASMQANLQRIAPTLMLDAYRKDHDNTAAAERLQRQLALQLGKLAEHEAFLQRQAAQTAALRQQLAAHFGTAQPAVCVVRFASPTSYWVYGTNSQPDAALRSLGLRNACPDSDTSAWGTRVRKLPDLLRLQAAVLVHIAPFSRQAELERSPLWQALPAVRQRQVLALAPVWTNGGLASQGRLEILLTQAFSRQ
ncbi:iron-siderophore ABC transporter substrate-binding protein [Chitinilyticum piscinae]|uniref:Iron-siderophore ABC transporter substrate-binding protein n=1 Tax=Chitinilyticum piscinae TaxID=2866724 RepID=A0A8J7FNC8_9NEIS|nr:iron-siderophore ABC transporter substrate-binding protein [Chitinilyticum piscinae]MBE9610635.1 iron-siderophore ABC transporter substrate-binding protein [Chitinilyticum piscinae]